MEDVFNPETGHLTNCKWRLNPNTFMVNETKPYCKKKVFDKENNTQRQCGTYIAKHCCLDDGNVGYCWKHYAKKCRKNKMWVVDLSPCANRRLDESFTKKDERIKINQFNSDEYNIPSDEKFNHISTERRKKSNNKTCDDEATDDEVVNNNSKSNSNRKRKVIEIDDDDNDEEGKQYDEWVFNNLTADLKCKGCGFEKKRNSRVCFICETIFN